jgi:hypothetical protein
MNILKLFRANTNTNTKPQAAVNTAVDDLQPLRAGAKVFFDKLSESNQYIKVKVLPLSQDLLLDQHLLILLTSKDIQTILSPQTPAETDLTFRAVNCNEGVYTSSSNPVIMPVSKLLSNISTAQDLNSKYTYDPSQAMQGYLDTQHWHANSSSLTRQFREEEPLRPNTKILTIHAGSEGDPNENPVTLLSLNNILVGLKDMLDPKHELYHLEEIAREQGIWEGEIDATTADAKLCIRFDANIAAVDTEDGRIVVNNGTSDVTLFPNHYEITGYTFTINKAGLTALGIEDNSSSIRGLTIKEGQIVDAADANIKNDRRECVFMTEPRDILEGEVGTDFIDATAADAKVIINFGGNIVAVEEGGNIVVNNETGVVTLPPSHYEIDGRNLTINKLGLSLLGIVDQKPPCLNMLMIKEGQIADAEDPSQKNAMITVIFMNQKLIEA